MLESIRYLLGHAPCPSSPLDPPLTLELTLVMVMVLQNGRLPSPFGAVMRPADSFRRGRWKEKTDFIKQILLITAVRLLPRVYGFLQLALISWFTMGTKKRSGARKSRQRERWKSFWQNLRRFETRRQATASSRGCVGMGGTGKKTVRR